MNKDIKHILVLVILGYFFFFFGNGLISLTSPDEVFYTQTAKEMAQNHTWLTPILFDQPQFEKPIFIYWCLRFSFIVFGTSSFAARFFPACFALIGVVGVYFLAKMLFNDQKKALVSSLILLSSSYYIGLARSVFTDMVFSVFILLALLSFYWGYLAEMRKGLGIILFFIFSALAVLTKGPLGLLIPLVVILIFLLVVRRTEFILSRYVLLGIIIFLSIALPWYILMTFKYNQSFIHEFFYNDHYRRLIEAEHIGNDTWYFYPLTMIEFLFPWSIFVLGSFFYFLRHRIKIDNDHLFLTCWIAVVLIIFQVAHSKLTSYIFPMVPALAMICSNFICDSILDQKRQREFLILSIINWFVFFLILVGIIFAASKFPFYVHSLKPVYFIVLIFSLWLFVISFSILKRKTFSILYLFMLFMPVLMSVIPFIIKDVEPYISSKYACEYFLAHYSPAPGTYLLCSKNFTRGIRFYTDIKVAVFTPGGQDFFSPHPIPFFDTDEKAWQFLNQQPLVYAFLKKKALDDLKRVGSGGFKYRVLKNIGNQYIVRINKK